MTEIKVRDLSNRNIFGADLFDDPENFMVELSDDSDVIGGFNLNSCASFGEGCTDQPKPFDPKCAPDTDTTYLPKFPDF